MTNDEEKRLRKEFQQAGFSGEQADEEIEAMKAAEARAVTDRTRADG